MQTTFGRAQKLTRDNRAPSESAAPQVSRPAETGFPLATITIGLALTLIFASELKFAVLSTGDLSASSLTLEAFGAVSRDLVYQDGQPWRILTASVLHGNIQHLVSNLVGFALAGFVLERAVGAKWLAFIFIASGIGGAIGSMAWNPKEVSSVGASGAIMGVAGAAIVTFLYGRCGDRRPRTLFALLLLAVPALIPSANDAVKIDYSAHFFGLITGSGIAFALQWIWPREARRPQGGNSALLAVAIGLLFYGAAFVNVAEGYHSYAARASRFAPIELLAKDLASIGARSETLLAQYPTDPRVRVARALFLLQQGQAAAAESHLRAALNLNETRDKISDVFKLQMQGLLAAAVLSQGRIEEARKIASPVCASAGGALWKLRQTLAKATLCQRPG